MNTWETAETARIQAENAAAEIAHWRDFEVYAVALAMFDFLAARGMRSIVDYGCGAGQYSRLAHRAGLGEYIGIDNPFAVAEARKLNPHAVFSPDWTIPACDVVLCAASIEYDPCPIGKLHELLTETPCRYLMLHRLRFTSPLEFGHFVSEQSWGGPRDMWRWNHSELYAQLATVPGANVIKRKTWGGEQWTYLIEKS